MTLKLCIQDNDWRTAHKNTDSRAAHDSTDSCAVHELLFTCNTRSLTRVLLTIACSTRRIVRVQHTKYGLHALHEFYLRAAHFVSHTSVDLVTRQKLKTTHALGTRECQLRRELYRSYVLPYSNIVPIWLLYIISIAIGIQIVAMHVIILYNV